MAEIALDYTYRYQRPSEVAWTDGKPQLSLTTSGVGEQPALFFRGNLVRPRLCADLLLALVRVVHSRFCLPPNMLARIKVLSDPVITCGEDRLRFETFSACCGVYGRVDLLPEAVAGSLLATGTTNVDFNPPMRAALAQLQDSEPAALTVGAEAVDLESGGQTQVERKVALPLRWLKGFVEVQAHQARMIQRFEVSGAEARRFLQGLPRQGTSGLAAWVARVGPGLRLSMLGGPGSVRVGGIERLRLLEDIVRHAHILRAYGAADSEASAWEVDCGMARMFVVLSPETWRSFSGEGQALSHLAETLPAASVECVRQALGWQPRVNVVALAQRCALEPARIESALARLGARGLVGYDLAEGAYFHRELPFDLSLVEALQPRLTAARQLLADGGVQLITDTPERIEAWVRGADCEYHVRITPEARLCTCPWLAKHPDDRGPCKHILAVQLATGDADDA
ncbi:MAG TPA: SWIM zinc finger family protein [Chthonomonadaceae bacterium]|nr:SWIM zinc finger family protein [Chthonomonadaceae bacterium]